MSTLATHVPETVVAEPGSAVMATATHRAGLLAQTGARPTGSQRLRDYITLTKPHIISLLLVTTITPMAVAARGWPGGWLILWTMVGGYLMAGSANATNMFIDRDIDTRMTRTSLRPIPSGRIAPGHALAYAIILGLAGFSILALQANLASAVLSLGG